MTTTARHTREWTITWNPVTDCEGIDAMIRTNDDTTTIALVVEASDAPLIQAAPEMLDALRRLIDFREPDSLMDQSNDVRLRVEHEEAWDRARALLARIESA